MAKRVGPKATKQMTRIVVTGYMLRHPVAGNVLAFFQHLLGLARLGHDVVYVEESGWPFSCYDPITEQWLDHPETGLDLVRSLFKAHGLQVRIIWVNRDTGVLVGADWQELKEMLRAADLLLNIGGVCWLPEFKLCRRRALIDMDPFFSQVKGFASEVLQDYHVHFSYGANIGGDGCTIPTRGFDWYSTVPPVVLDLWDGAADRSSNASFTTVANWGAYGDFVYEGEEYGQKNREFQRLLPLPDRSGQNLEIALSGAGDHVRQQLRNAGWSVISGGAVAGTNIPRYQDYIQSSRGEFSAAKHAYVKTRSGWFSDRSVCYLAAGLPVILQDTGYGDWLPIGRGVLPFSSLDEAVECLARVNREYELHRRAARELAETVFDYRVVLSALLQRVHHPTGAVIRNF
jgi:hypothetical protein